MLNLRLQKKRKDLTKQTEEYHGNLQNVRADKEVILKSCNKLHGILTKLSETAKPAETKTLGW